MRTRLRAVVIATFRVLGRLVRGSVRFVGRHPWLLATLIVVAAAVAFGALLVLVYGPLTDLAGGPTVRDIRAPKDRAAAINTVRQTSGNLPALGSLGTPEAALECRDDGEASGGLSSTTYSSMDDGIAFSRSFSATRIPVSSGASSPEDG